MIGVRHYFSSSKAILADLHHNNTSLHLLYSFYSSAVLNTHAHAHAHAHAHTHTLHFDIGLTVYTEDSVSPKIVTQLTMWHN
jgi:hypothetical protein